MNDKSKTNEQLIEELHALRRLNAELTAATAESPGSGTHFSKHQTEEEALDEINIQAKTEKAKTAGNVATQIGVVREITRRNRLEQALTESERLYRLLFESAGDAILILDAEEENRGRIIDANRAAAEIHGYTIEELLSMKITDLDTPETAQQAPERMRRILGGEQIKAEVTHFTKNREVVHFEISARSIEIGGHTYILAVERDISERKCIEAEREKLIGELQHALENIRTLRGLIPICSWCKKIRDDKGYWGKIESYLEKHSHASFTHGICPDCLKKESPEVYLDIKNNSELYDRLINYHDKESDME